MVRPYGSGPYGSGPYGGGHTLENDFRRFGFGLVTLVEITLAIDGMKLYLSTDTARYSEHLYDGKLINVSSVRRALQKNLGIFESSNIEIVLSDVDQAYSLQALQLKGATVVIKIGSDLMSLGTFQTIAAGKIDDYSMSGFVLRASVKDTLFEISDFPLVGDVNETDFPNSYPGDRDRPLFVCYGQHSVTSSDDNKDRGAWPTLYIDNGIGTKKFLIARHPVLSIDQVYVFKSSSGSALLTAGTDYTAVTDGLINGEHMAYLAFTDTQFTNSVLDSGSLGVLTCNVQGRMNNDGSLMTNPIDVLIDLLSAYFNNPEIDATSFAAARVVADNRFYAVQGGYVTKQSTAELLQDICKSFNIRLYITKDGKIACNIFAPAPLGSSEFSFIEARDMLAGTFSVDHNSNIEGAQDTQVINKVSYQSQFHYAKQKYFKSDTFEDATSIARFGEKLFSLTTPWAGADSANDVAQRLVYQFTNPVPHYRFRTPLQGALVDIGDQVTVTHDNGPEGVPIDAQRMEIIEHTVNPMRGEVDLRGIDVTALTENAFWLGDESAYVRANTGTAGVTNGSGTITITSGPASLITAGVVVGDIIRLTTGNNISNHGITGVTATTVTVSNTVWTNETGITYDILPSWTTATAAQKVYGHLCEETTGEFSNGDDAPVLL